MTYVKVFILVLLASTITSEELRLGPMPPRRAFLNFIAATGLNSDQASHNGRWCILKKDVDLKPIEQCPGVWYSFDHEGRNWAKCCAADHDLDAKSIEYQRNHPNRYWHE